MVNKVRWVLWGQDWWDWDHEWGRLGAMGSGLGGLGGVGMVNRVHWVLWGRDWWDWVGVQGVAWHHMGVQERASTQEHACARKGRAKGGVSVQEGRKPSAAANWGGTVGVQRAEGAQCDGGVDGGGGARVCKAPGARGCEQGCVGT